MKLKREGRGYQTEINQALRNYIKQDTRPIQDLRERSSPKGA